MGRARNVWMKTSDLDELVGVSMCMVGSVVVGDQSF